LDHLRAGARAADAEVSRTDSAISPVSEAVGIAQSPSRLWSIPGFMHTWFCVTQLRQVALL
jgi:hypothetical protein